MVVNQKVTGTASSMPAGLALGGAVSTILTVITTALCAWLISRESLPQESVGYCVMVILVASSTMGAWVSVKRIKHRKLLVCTLSGAIYFAILIATNILFFGGLYSGVGVTALLILCGCGLVVLSGTKGEGRSHSRKRRRKHR